LLALSLFSYSNGMMTPLPNTATLNKPLLPAEELGLKHLAIIMDGNRRWAKERHLPVWQGHKAGVASLRKVVTAAQALGLSALTVYAFSTENWQRSPAEVQWLMQLFVHALKSDMKAMHSEGVKLALKGDWQALPPAVVAAFTEVLALTANNTGLTLCLAVNYGSQQHLTAAVAHVIQQAQANPTLATSLTPQHVEAALNETYCTCALPPVDALLRPGGEQRLSNFLLWELAYAELIWSPVLWPDADEALLVSTLETFAQRQRRFGQ
jgi:undecaprenyl diphosphate synthase